ncbi:DUF2207 domain-containing protein [Paenibacillus campi]|uniref:DUF2207 domain-containing protein n=1 Tax=Paenibacillus campi TaxID=3106031 RepID=UPI002AFE0474|nr:DUF2207 domain-containing protein [Paenibacillus sp. SGZ-1014]
MQKRLLLYTLLVMGMLTASLLYIPIATATSQQDAIENRSFFIDRVDIQAQLLNDGDMEVEELYTYTFDGKYHETIRTIGKEGHDGVEFFKAYEVDKAFNKNQWSPAQFQQLPALKVQQTVSADLFKYAAVLPAENETKKVLYHYRLRDVLKNSNGIGYWNWKFFDYRNPSMIGMVHIRMELPEAIADGKGLQVHAYTYAPDEGILNVHDHRVISYEYPWLFTGEPLDMRISFPLAAQLENHLASQMDNSVPSVSLANEKWTDWHKWDWLMTLSVLIIILFLIMIVPLCVWHFIVIPVCYRISLSRYMRLDMLELKAIYSRGEWDAWSILAGVFSLYKRDLVDVDFKKASIHDVTPSLAFSKREQISQRLRADETYLLDWLFTQDGGNMFAINSIFMIATSKSASKYQQNQSRQRLKKIHSCLPQWGELVRKELKLPDPSVYELIKLLRTFVGYSLATTLFVKCLNINNLSIVYVRSPITYWIALDSNVTSNFFWPWFDPFFYLGIGVCIGIWIVIGLSFLMQGVYNVMSSLTNRSVGGEPRFLEKLFFLFMDREELHVFKKGIAVSFLLNLCWLCALNPSSSQLEIIVCAIFLCVVVCFYPVSMHKKELPIQQLRHRLMSGKYNNVTNVIVLEWLFQASLILQCADEFLQTHPQLKRIADQHSEYELLSKAPRILYAVNRIWGSIVEFESRERELQERKEGNRVKREQARTRSNDYISSSSSDSSSYSSDSSSSSSSDSSDSGGGGGSSSD